MREASARTGLLGPGEYLVPGADERVSDQTGQGPAAARRLPRAVAEALASGCLMASVRLPLNLAFSAISM